MEGQSTMSGRAGGTIRPYRFVYQSGSEDNTLLECNAADRPIGVSQGSSLEFDSDNHATDGLPVYLQAGYMVRLQTGGAVVRGYPVGPDEDGKAIEGSGGYAIALQSASAEDEIIDCCFVPGLWNTRPVIHAASSLTLTEQSSGAFVDNQGNSGNVTITLPSAPPEGTFFHFHVIGTNQLRIEPGASSAIYGLGDESPTDNKFIFADDTGECIGLYADSAGDWHTFAVDGTWTSQS